MATLLELPEFEPATSISGARVGRLAGIDGDGLPLVDFDGCPFGLMPARVGVLGPANWPELAAQGAAVVLVFENADPTLPIIVGVLSSLPVQPAAVPEQVVVEAQDELVLRCGLGSLTIRADGKILVKGTNITSHAQQVHRIKGGAVRIN